jgi:hypothetical protein
MSTRISFIGNLVLAAVPAVAIMFSTLVHVANFA